MMIPLRLTSPLTQHARTTDPRGFPSLHPSLLGEHGGMLGVPPHRNALNRSMLQPMSGRT